MKHQAKSLINRYPPTICLLLLFLINCNLPEHQSGILTVGSDLDAKGLIKNQSLNFVFPPYIKKGKNRDFFNHLYFSGDTLCFSITLKQEYLREEIHVQYVNSKNGLSINAERIDLYGKTVSGFCLIGSIMEHFYNSNLDESFQLENFDNKQIPISIVLNAFNTQTGSIRIQIVSSFRISIQNL